MDLKAIAAPRWSAPDHKAFHRWQSICKTGIYFEKMNITGNTHLKILLALLSVVFATGCVSNTQKKGNSASSTQVTKAETLPAAAPKSAVTVGDCQAAETFIYSDESFSSYTEDKMRGTGVVSFQLDINDRLDIYNEDDSKFGFLVYNEDETFYMLDMPSKVIARAVIPAADVAQFDFDAEAIDTDKDNLIIYVNKKKRKVKKADVKFTFSNWDDYIKHQIISLKACNMFPAAHADKDLLYEVIQKKGDKIKIRSLRDCSGEDSGFRLVEGWVKWKNGDLLTVDLTSCD